MAARRPAGDRLLLLAAVGATAALRLWHLDADPSPAMPDATVMDEGLWADSARGLVWFDEGAFADDLGNAYLVAPLYTFLLAGLYSVFGVGLWQTRLLSALCSIGTAALAGDLVRRRSGARLGALATLLVGICPLLDQHGRFALLESAQGFLLLLSFALLFPLRPTLRKAACAGAAMGAAALVKPNAATLGAVPFALAFVVEWRAAARAGAPAVHRDHLRRGLAAALGGLVVALAIGAPVWLAHWHEFTATLDYESGSANWTLGEHLLRLGLTGAREKEPGHLLLWAPLRHAAVLAAGLWLAALARALGRPAAPMPLRRPLWIWILGSFAITETSFDHVARRQVLFLPAFAILAAWTVRDLLARSAADPHAAGTQPTTAPARPWSPWCIWLLLLLPPLLLAKPMLANALAPLLRSAGVADDLGAPGLLGGWIVTVAIALAPAVPSLLRLDARRAGSMVLRVGPWLLLALALAEIPRLSALPPLQYTMRNAQDRLATLVAPGSIVLGEHAATLLQPVRVRTVRRVIAGRQYSSPRPNPDVAERLRPRYVVDYADSALREFADVTDGAFHVVAEIGLLREADGRNRFQLRLWERN